MKLTKPKILQIAGMLIWGIYILVPSGVVPASLPFYLVTATPGIILFQYGVYSEYIRSKRGPNVEYGGIRFKTIYPRATLNIVIMLIVEGLLCISLVRDHQTILAGFIAATMTLISVCLIVMVERLFFAKLTVTFGADYLVSSYNNKFDITQIQCIYRSHRRVGIKLIGKRLVPFELSFYFQQKEEPAGLKELYDWSKRNSLQIVSKRF